jgi:putative alpha-1,2-mannosidase
MGHDIPDNLIEILTKKIIANFNRQLEKITVTGGTRDRKAAFYTAMYHAMMDPRTITDLNGDYPDADGKIHKATGFTKASIFSGWDVFRSEFPLQTIINPRGGKRHDHLTCQHGRSKWQGLPGTLGTIERLFGLHGG